MAQQLVFTLSEARKIGELLGIGWDTFGVEEFHRGLNIELKHKLSGLQKAVKRDPLLIARMVQMRLTNYPDYYLRLEDMEEGAKFFWEVNPESDLFVYQALKKYIEQQNTAANATGASVYANES